jgi:hypothetical protein
VTSYSFDYRRDRFTVAADTLGYLPDQRQVKPMGFINKVRPLNHARSVVFARGQQWILAQAVAEIEADTAVDSFEAAQRHLSESLRRNAVRYAELVGIDKRKLGTTMLIEITLAGWSQTEKRTRFCQFTNYDADFVPLPNFDGQYSGPHAWPTPPDRYRPALNSDQSLDEQMISLILATDQFFRSEPERNYGQRVGGEIIRTEVTPDGISQDIIYEFADRQETAHAAAAVVARIERGDLDDLAAVRDGLGDIRTILPTHVDAAAASAPVAPLNRQRRRAIERATRRAA